MIFMDRSQLKRLEVLEKKGALQVLAILLEEDKYISELIKRSAYDFGLVSQSTLEKTRMILVTVGLIEEYEKTIELTQKTRRYLRLTEKGKVVAERVKALAESLA